MLITPKSPVWELKSELKTHVFLLPFQLWPSKRFVGTFEETYQTELISSPKLFSLQTSALSVRSTNALGIQSRQKASLVSHPLPHPTAIIN